MLGPTKMDLLTFLLTFCVLAFCVSHAFLFKESRPLQQDLDNMDENALIRYDIEDSLLDKRGKQLTL